MLFKEYLKLARVNHWIKNGFVFVPLLFSKNLFDINLFFEAAISFLVFGLVSSSIYVFNDICDVEADRKHSQKKSRPIAGGKISIKSGWYLIALLVFVSIPILFRFSSGFVFVILFYFILNIFYSLYLKKIVLVDIFSIAGGFILRVLAGAFAINVEVSSWLILSTLFISLFIAIIKRKSEITTQSDNLQTRAVLQNYTQKFIDQMAAISAAGVIICYALYSVSAKVLNNFHSDYFVYTTIFVIYGIFRYLLLSHQKDKGEDPAELILKDFPSLFNIVLFVTSVIIIVYN